MAIVVSSHITFALCVAYGVTNGYKSDSKINFWEALNGLGGMATFLAFVLAYYQLHRDKNSQKQLAYLTEAKDQIKAMIGTISLIQTGRNSSLTNLDNCATFLSNYAQNFDDLYQEMTEGTDKDIARMRWQDMHYNHLQPKLSEVDPVSILANSLDDTPEKLRALSHARYLENSVNTNQEILRPLKKLAYTHLIFKSEIVKNLLPLEGKISSLDHFVYYFFNIEYTKQLTTNLLSQPDIRTIAPVLLSAKPSDFALKNMSYIEKNQKEIENINWDRPIF